MMTVLELKTEITKEERFQHLEFPFTLEKDFTRLLIKYSYSPKNYIGEDFRLAYEAFKEAYGDVEVQKSEVCKELPLKNHVTLSLLKEGEWLGTAHRHAEKLEVEVCKAVPTVGFKPFKPTEGSYAIVLSTHAVLSEKIEVSIEVLAYE